VQDPVVGHESDATDVPGATDSSVGGVPTSGQDAPRGTAQPDGAVSDAEFLEFVDRVITPRFPDGLTLLKGDGQFRGEDGTIVKEDSFLLILLYPLDTFEESSRKINTIRQRYKNQFQQESVLRVDDPFAVRVSF